MDSDVCVCAHCTLYREISRWECLIRKCNEFFFFFALLWIIIMNKVFACSHRANVTLKFLRFFFSFCSPIAWIVVVNSWMVNGNCKWKHFALFFGLYCCYWMSNARKKLIFLVIFNHELHKLYEDWIFTSLKVINHNSNHSQFT